MTTKIKTLGKLKMIRSASLTEAGVNPYSGVPFLNGFVMTLNPMSGVTGLTVQAFVEIPTSLNFANLMLVFTDASGNVVPLTSQKQGAQANELDWVVPQTPSGIYILSIVLFSDVASQTPLYQAQSQFTVIETPTPPTPPPPKKKPKKKHGKKKDGKKKHGHKNPKKKHKK
jgi:hypothetical protein